MSIIYHYCSKDVFRFIAKTKEIWLTDLSKTNDKTEYKSGFEIIQDILHERDLLKNPHFELVNPDNLNKEFRILIGCFSLDGDLRSQWIDYGDNCTGLSIGFDQVVVEQNDLFNRFINNNLSPISKHVKFAKVNYDTELFRRDVHNLIDGLEQNNPVLKYKLMALGLRRLASRYKHPFWSPEQEIRCFIETEAGINDTYDIGIRPTRYGDAFFHKLNTSFESIHSIREIIIGPLCPLTIEDVQNCLVEERISDVKVRYSVGKDMCR